MEKDTHITLIGINRELHRNSLDTATITDLSRALEDLETDDESSVAVLYGVGGSFGSGNDLKEMESQADVGNVNSFCRPTHRHSRKPIVCSINGFCVGSGLELALICDVRVMEDSAVLGFFNRYLGVPLLDAGTVRLPAMIGISRAMDLIMTGRRVGGKEALNIGLISRLVATGTSLGQAVSVAFSIAKYPMASLQHDRRSLLSACYERSQGFQRAIQNELSFDSAVPREMLQGVKRFKNCRYSSFINGI